MENKVEIINFLIDDENEAIKGYDEAIKSFDSFTDIDNDIKEKIRQQLEHIREEEVEHIEELDSLLKIFESKNEQSNSLKENLADTFTLEDAIDVAYDDHYIGILDGVEELEKKGFDCSYYYEKINDLEDPDDSGVDEETGIPYDNANIYYRDKLWEKLGIKEIMEKAYDILDLYVYDKRKAKLYASINDEEYNLDDYEEI